ncbi:hypothetical protein D3C85_1766390 [compost metagenome]
MPSIFIALSMAAMVFSGINPRPPRCASALNFGNSAVFWANTWPPNKDTAMNTADTFNFMVYCYFYFKIGSDNRSLFHLFLKLLTFLFLLGY